MSPKNPLHQKIILELQKASGGPPKMGLFMVHYCGSDKPGYDLNTPSHTKIIKEFIIHHDLSAKDYTDLITSLFTRGLSYNELIIGGSLVSQLLKNNPKFDPNLLDKWLKYVHGWAETDVLCQSNFTPEIMLNNWSAWSKTLTQFVKDKNVHKRRASLVLLCKSLRLSPDQRLLNLALNNVEVLKSVKDILITKAISWVLRSMVTHHGGFLADYLSKNKDTLPKIAYREAYTKLTTGRKYNRPSKSYSTKVRA